MSLQPGTHLGDYEVIAPIGAGGMGEVYRASDQNLGREVALKIVPAGDAESIARFEREARSIAALSHPNILQVYRFGVDRGTHYLVTELVSGETLGSVIRRGSLSWREVAGLAAQICDGLAAAHAKGIIHRDLKPENVMITADRRAKILDFGLATAEWVLDPQNDKTALKTAPGTVMGTLYYMSPEQLRGEQVDASTDLFSLGSILFEMLTGRAPFARSTAAETMSAILNDDPPDITTVPPEMNAIVQRCLQKDRARRFHSAHDLSLELQRLGEEPRRDAPRRAAPLWLAVLAAMAVAVAAAWFFLRDRTGPLPASRTTSQPPSRTLTQISFAKEVEQFPAWSPDGRSIAFTRDAGARRKIFVRSLADASERQLTQGNEDDLFPAWSPDGRTILFMRSQRSGQRVAQADLYMEYTGADIWRLDLQGGGESLLIRNGSEPAFSPDGSLIAFSASWSGPPRIWIADRNGLNARQASTDSSESVNHARPRWSPDGKRLVFQTIIRNTQFDIRAVDLDTGRQHSITDDRTLDLNPVWCPTGRYIYFSTYRGGGINVWRVPIGRDGAFGAHPEQVTTGAGQDLDLAISPDGRRLAMATLRQNADLWRLPLSPEGTVTGPAEELVATTREETRGAWSPDGSQIAFSSDRGGEMNIWIRDVARGTDRQLTRGPGGDFQPDWSPDGARITFFSRRGPSLDIWEAGVRSGALRQLTRHPTSETHSFYSPDGSQIAYLSDATGRLEAWVMQSDGSGARQVSRSGASIHFIRWTPDGKQISCPSLAEGAPRLSMIDIATGQEAPTAITLSGAHHSYSPDRSRIIDVRNHQELWVAKVSDGVRKVLFTFDDPQIRIDYPVWSPDGKWLLFDRLRPEGGDIWVMDGL